MIRMQPGAEPPVTRKGLKGPLAGLGIGILLLFLAALLFAWSTLYGAGPAEQTEISFAPGTSVAAMARQLHDKKIIRSSLAFRVAARFGGKANRFKAGTYQFPAGASLMTVLHQIESGRVIRSFVTIPEGRTSRQAVRILKAVTDLTGDIDVPPEGSILPETYDYQRGETRQAVLDRMLDAGRKALDEEWAKRQPDLPVKTKEEALILASVVEKETGIASERPRVAAVFVNRLRKGMRLESDPTVIYGISNGEPLGRGLLRSELDKKTPWNTYAIDGLPVTPIGNPGRAALRAVLNPAKTEDIFFVADGTGGHVFAATYEEHLANVAKWRKVEAEVSMYTTPAFDAAVDASAVAPNAGQPVAAAVKGKN